MLRNIFISLFLIGASNFNFAQQSKSDSLVRLIETAKADTTRFKIYIELGNHFRNFNPDSAILYYKEALTVSKEMNNLKRYYFEAKAMHDVGWGYYLKSDFQTASKWYISAIKLMEPHLPNIQLKMNKKELNLLAYSYLRLAIAQDYLGKSDEALNFNNKALNLFEQTKTEEGIAAVLGNVGLIYYELSDYKKALENFYLSMKICEKNDMKSGVSANLGNIGMVYMAQEDYIKAKDYYNQAQKIDEHLQDLHPQSANLANLGVIHKNLGQLDSALYYFERALATDRAIQNNLGIAINYSNIGLAFVAKGNFDSAFEYLNNAYNLNLKSGNHKGQIVNLIALGELQIKQKKYNDAKDNLLKAEYMARSMGDKIDIKNVLLALSKVYEALNNHQKSLLYYREFVQIRDSLHSEQNQKALIQKEMQYEFDKKAASDSIATAKQKEIHEAEIAKQNAEIKAKRNQQLGLYGGLALLIVFCAVMYNRFKITKKQKTVIEFQKHVVEEKQKEILDSISYAKRIQSAILPSSAKWNSNLPGSFVLYKPKDIVAGDFYWMEKQENYLFVAAADCTGHGVPGAMVSVICSNALSKVVLEDKSIETNEILDKVREVVIERIAGDGNMRDGMDICLLRINLIDHTIQYSGANRSLWVVQPSILIQDPANGIELVEIKGDKQPIGRYENAKPFSKHNLDVQSGTMLYLTTDGYADQFGGDKGKKFSVKSLKAILQELQSDQVDDQMKALELNFDRWKGRLEQVDDVTIVGIRI